MSGYDFQNILCFFLSENLFTSTNSEDPYKMLHYDAFKLGRQRLLKYSFWGFLNTKG